MLPFGWGLLIWHQGQLLLWGLASFGLSQSTELGFLGFSFIQQCFSSTYYVPSMMLGKGSARDASETEANISESLPSGACGWGDASEEMSSYSSV